MLDLFGRVLIAALRPNVAKACKFVYPNRPEAADARLVSNIVRDSKDPGGYSVIAAGAKLPVRGPHAFATPVRFLQRASTGRDVCAA
jgi:hypothetical protein